MSYLIDTNVISEVRKGPNAHPAVAHWWEDAEDNALWLSALVIGEIRQGVERARRRDPRQAQALEAWLQAVTTEFNDRVLPVNSAVAETWGRLNGSRPLPVIDALLAATALVNDLTLVTRNVEDIEGTGVAVLNPWTQAPMGN